MEKIVSDYLGKLEFVQGSLTVEVGYGAGAVTRRIAEKANPERVIWFEPSVGFVKEAKVRVSDCDNVDLTSREGPHFP